MPSPLITPTRPATIAVAVAFALLLAGCASDAPATRPAAHYKPAPPLAGRAMFFDGLVEAQLTLGTSPTPVGEPRESKGGDAGGGESGHGHRRGSGSGLSVGGGSGGASAGMGRMGERSGGEWGGGERPGDTGSDTGEGRRSNLRPQGGPAVMIHIQLTNHGTDPLVVSVPDFSSVLGNFVVFPAQLTVAPGQSAEFEPMTSRLGGEFSEVDASLTLSAGSRVEKKVIAMRQLPATAAPPAVPDAPPPH